ncbi:MAG: phosphoribosylpyrophosphate synthetase [Runella slithyformis]|jgi:hypothetical protein|nr:MAG: phosphoribosylpyrophosphate synthetase [Runella slithyformis]TAF94183.1 MAG: phosphoribosylpyrophosphate synthetase [Runella sp.]TAG18673.1 MAG: phosphoribosylpyrophosphate synthetase [Cytophagales bacterium]TAG38223.1 MAG: phosphoribosylpyrophosphate synthetase [Cytophagia bacterium]TAF23277.1 MAG: phosphoribosylpyrophosphate synthetase [Runella slithyformis]
MESYNTLVEALNDLKSKGFEHDFNLDVHCLSCHSIGQSLRPDEFEIVDFYRFEGMTDPADSSILYAISSKDGQFKGTFINAYGTYADEMSDDMIEKLKIHRQN